MNDTKRFLVEAIGLAHNNVVSGGRPFVAVVVRNGAVIARGVNEILATNDPTSHAELNALRAAGRALGTPDLAGCEVYASGQPCPMCVAAMRMAGVTRVRYAFSNEEAEPYGLSTAAIYADLAKPFAEQSMDILHEGTAAAPEIYASWHDLQRNKAP